MSVATRVMSTLVGLAFAFRHRGFRRELRYFAVGRRLAARGRAVRSFVGGAPRVGGARWSAPWPRSAVREARPQPPGGHERAEHQAVVTAVTDFWLEAAEAIADVTDDRIEARPVLATGPRLVLTGDEADGISLGTAGCSGWRPSSPSSRSRPRVDVALPWDRHRVVLDADDEIDGPQPAGRPEPAPSRVARSRHGGRERSPGAGRTPAATRARESARTSSARARGGHP
jgi:hypothetical protein